MFGGPPVDRWNLICSHQTWSHRFSLLLSRLLLSSSSRLCSSSCSDLISSQYSFQDSLYLARAMSNQIFTNMQNIWHSRLQYRFSLFLSRLSEPCRSCKQPSQEAKRGWETAWFVDSWCSQIGERKTKNFWSENQHNGEQGWWKSKKITNVGASFKVGMLFWFSVT